MMRTIGRLAVLVLALVLGGGACLTEPTCSDPDYPLDCRDNKACCPAGLPINCGGVCYATVALARARCDAPVDTCQ
jgi:hypothetical protein